MNTFETGEHFEQQDGGPEDTLDVLQKLHALEVKKQELEVKLEAAARAHGARPQEGFGYDNDVKDLLKDLREVDSLMRQLQVQAWRKKGAESTQQQIEGL